MLPGVRYLPRMRSMLNAVEPVATSVSNATR